MVGWKYVRKTKPLHSDDSDVIPDIGIPMVILPCSQQYDFAYGPEWNLQNKEKKKVEHEKGSTLTIHRLYFSNTYLKYLNYAYKFIKTI